MLKITTFKIKKNDNATENLYKIKDIIEGTLKNNEINNLSMEISRILDVPLKEINLKMKQLIYGDFKFFQDEPSFNLKFNFFNSLKYFFLIKIILFFNFFRVFKPNKSKKIDIILDNIEGDYVVKKFNLILKKFKNCLIVKRGSVEILEKYNNLLITNINSIAQLNCKIKNYSILVFFLRCFLKSKKLNFNLIKIYFFVFTSYVKYSSLFKKYDSKVLIHDRIYHTCPIRNYIFKKNKNRRVLCLQTHIAETTITMFSAIDILLKWGEENDTEKKIKVFGGSINEAIPVGSLRMQYELENLKPLNEISEIDILVIGINAALWKGTSKIIYDIYYEQMGWIVKLTKKFPKLKVVYKHHPTFLSDPKEKEIYSKSNITPIVVPKNNSLNSYHYLLKSKLCISFASSMIIEGLSEKNNCFFLDPDFNNDIFFNNLKYLKDTRLQSYEELENLVEKVFVQKKEFENLNLNKFCLNRKLTSDKISNLITGIQNETL